MQKINGKFQLEQGDLLNLKDGRQVKFISFNVWDAGLIYVLINGIKECIFTNELDLDAL